MAVIRYEIEGYVRRDAMQVDETERGFVIVRGKDRDVFFSFFVDDDRSCWTNYSPGARLYAEKDRAENDLQELRKRARTSRKRP